LYKYSAKQKFGNLEIFKTTPDHSIAMVKKAENPQNEADLLGHPVSWKDQFHQCGKIPIGKKRELCFTDLSKYAELVENFLDAAEASEAAGDSERSKQMWIKYAEQMAQKEYYWDSAFAYRLAGNEEKFQEMLNIIVETRKE
jgi:hypothetical protein